MIFITVGDVSRHGVAHSATSTEAKFDTETNVLNISNYVRQINFGSDKDIPNNH